ncbi:MAG: hypothetical protein AAF221_08070 [Pseudomonadota bacterium]
MDIIIYLRAIAALGLVLALIWGGVWLLRRYGSGFFGASRTPGDKSLAVLERLDLPHRKTLVRVGDGAREHLLLLSATGDVVVESRNAVEPKDAHQ